jgi:hypothetical protein
MQPSPHFAGKKKFVPAAYVLWRQSLAMPPTLAVGAEWQTFTADLTDLSPWTVDIADEGTTLLRNAGTLPINHPLRLGLTNSAVTESRISICHFTPTLCVYHAPSRRKLNWAEANELHHIFEDFPNFSVRILVWLWAGRPSNRGLITRENGSGSQPASIKRLPPTAQVKNANSHVSTPIRVPLCFVKRRGEHQDHVHHPPEFPVSRL